MRVEEQSTPLAGRRVFARETDRFVAASRWLVANLWVYLVGVLVAALVSAAFIAAMRGDIWLAYRTIISSSLGSLAGFAQTLNKTTPFLLGSIAVTIALRGGFFNIGVDGQIYAGAIATTGVAFAIGAWSLPPAAALPLVLFAGLLGGATFGAIPGFLRARWAVNEIFITVMLNFVAWFLTEYLTTGPWNDPTTGEAMSRPIPAEAMLPMLLSQAGAHTGILIGVAAVAFAWWLLGRTVVGYEIRAVGSNARAARIGGISVPWIAFSALTVSGGLAGLAGAIEVAGFHNRLILGLTPGYGLMAVLIAVLSKRSPVGVAVVSFAVAILLVGADSLQRSVGLPASAALVFQSIVVLCVLLVEARTTRAR